MIGRVAIGSRRTLVSGVNFRPPSPPIAFSLTRVRVSSVRSTTPVSGLNVATRSPRECNRAFPRAERRATRRAVMLPGAGARPHRSRTSQSSRVQKACQKAPDDESESPRSRICAPAPGSRVVSPRRTRRLTLEPPHRHRQRSPPRIRRRSRHTARSSAPRVVAPKQTLPILRSPRRLPRSLGRRCHRARASARPTRAPSSQSHLPSTAAATTSRAASPSPRRSSRTRGETSQPPPARRAISPRGSRSPSPRTAPAGRVPSSPRPRSNPSPPHPSSTSIA